MKKLILLGVVFGMFSNVVLAATDSVGEDLGLKECIFADQSDRGDEIDNNSNGSDSSSTEVRTADNQ